ncbi:hypothetical protein IG631_07243 [Alternaria alternata]|nr:hypothetical protein IG631_07243 [Alternaria alternata]
MGSTDLFPALASVALLAACRTVLVLASRSRRPSLRCNLDCSSSCAVKSVSSLYSGLVHHTTAVYFTQEHTTPARTIAAPEDTRSPIRRRRQSA